MSLTISSWSNQYAWSSRRQVRNRPMFFLSWPGGTADRCVGRRLPRSRSYLSHATCRTLRGEPDRSRIGWPLKNVPSLHDRQLVRLVARCRPTLKQLGQPMRAHRQRITAGQQHIRHLLVSRDVLQSGRNIVGDLVVVVHEQTFSKTVTAVGTTNFVTEQQHGVRVFVLHSTSYGDSLLIACV